MEDAAAKLQTYNIEITPQKPQLSFDNPPPMPHEFSFFSSRSRRRGSDTWIISVFVIFHILAFITTMFVNDCSANSHGDCAIQLLGRMSFQPLSENPLLGPSASTLDKVGALQRKYFAEKHQMWRLFTCTWLHAGVVHLIINLGCIIFVGIHLERDFGPLRVGIIYLLSGFVGSLVCALFVRNSPVTTASGALSGLLGAIISGLIRNWKVYTNKCAALALLFIISMINFLLGLLPYVDNFSNMGAFISGSLLGLVLLFTPQARQVAQYKTELIEYTPTMLTLKLDRPVLRSVSLMLFSVVFAGCLVAVLQDMNINDYCGWCRYVDCVPFRRWSCSEITSSCESMVSNSQTTLTCMGNGNFRVFPYTNITHSRMRDLCTLIC
ncbi:hypothetical protein SLA2020_416140 [Shorea laevis]